MLLTLHSTYTAVHLSCNLCRTQTIAQLCYMYIHFIRTTFQWWCVQYMAFYLQHKIYQRMWKIERKKISRLAYRRFEFDGIHFIHFLSFFRSFSAIKHLWSQISYFNRSPIDTEHTLIWKNSCDFVKYLSWNEINLIHRNMSALFSKSLVVMYG